MMVRHILVYALGRGVPGLVNILAVMIYTRILSPEGYGLYGLIIASVGFGNSVVFEWLRISLLRFYPASGQPNRLLSVVLGLFLLTSTLMLICMLSSLYFVANLESGVATISLLLLLARGWYELNLTLARSQLAPTIYGLMTLFRSVATLAIGYLLVVLVGLNAYGPILGMIFGMIGASIIFMGKQWHLRPNLSHCDMIRRLIEYGVPLSLNFTLGFVISMSDRFLISWMINVKSAGVYAANYDLGWTIIFSIALTINLACYPVIIRKYEQGGADGARKSMRDSLTLQATMVVPIMILVAGYGNAISEAFLGKSFHVEASRLLLVISLSAVFGSLKLYYFDLSFQLGKQTMIQVWINLIVAILNIIINVSIIPYFGMIAAAYSTLLSYVVGSILALIVGRRVIVLPFPLADLAKVALAGGAMLFF